MMPHATRRCVSLSMFGLIAIGVNLAMTPSIGNAQFEALFEFAKGFQKEAVDDSQIQFLKPTVNLEVSFIKRVCEPTDHQMTAIVEAAEKAYRGMTDVVADQNARRIVRNQNALINVIGPNNERLTENPYLRIRNDAAKYLKPILRTDQYERYAKESGDRTRFEREAAIDIAVGLVDDKLVLSDQQRGELTKKLLETWKSVDIQQMQIYLFNPQFSPAIDESSMKSVLTEKQFAAWRSLPNTSFSINFGNQQDSGLDEDWIK